jgi:F420-dependent methylenetetrahydromethanopterin dehydrogenase
MNQRYIIIIINVSCINAIGTVKINANIRVADNVVEMNVSVCHVMKNVHDVLPVNIFAMEFVENLVLTV